MRAAGVLWTLGALLALGGCSGEGRSDAGAGDSQRHAVMRDDGWSLQEAVDPPANDSLASTERPPLDWYGEYVRTIGPEGQMVRLSGHRVTLGGAREALENVGFTFDDLDVAGWSAVGGTAASDPSAPAVVLLDNEQSTFVLLSYELDLDALTELGSTVEAVDKDSWVEAGGVIR